MLSYQFKTAATSSERTARRLKRRRRHSGRAAFRYRDVSAHAPRTLQKTESRGRPRKQTKPESPDAFSDIEEHTRMFSFRDGVFVRHRSLNEDKEDLANQYQALDSYEADTKSPSSFSSLSTDSLSDSLPDQKLTWPYVVSSSLKQAVTRQASPAALP